MSVPSVFKMFVKLVIQPLRCLRSWSFSLKDVCEVGHSAFKMFVKLVIPIRTNRRRENSLADTEAQICSGLCSITSIGEQNVTYVKIMFFIFYLTFQSLFMEDAVSFFSQCHF